MIKIFIEGIILGLGLAIMLGPAFFAIIQTSIDKGFKQAIQFAIGVSLSDISIICLVYFGLSDYIENEPAKIYSGIVGGVLLIVFGVYTFLKKPNILKRRTAASKSTYKKIKVRNYGFFTYFMKGYFLNILNPAVILYWGTMVSIVTAKAPMGKTDEYALAFFIGILATVFCTDILKSYAGNKIKRFMRPRIQIIINKTVGVILACFGFILITQSYL